MPDCYLCLPTCENCKPKFVVCDNCGSRVFMDLKACPLCKTEISEAAREKSWEEWRERHPQ